MASGGKFMPGSDAEGEDIFKYPFFDDETKQFISNHGRIMFIVRGPPGTGKKTLTDIMLKNYPEGIVCSADHYFDRTFTTASRTKESLAKSHEYCHKRVEEECIKGANAIIISNTHMKKMEMQIYLNYAAKFGYTIIMAITLDKFIVSSEILAKSNTKGLSKEYFDRRLKQWQDVFPLLTGWFLCLNDSSYLLNDLKSALDALLGDGKFCRVFNAFDRDKLYESFQAKDILFCVAGYSRNSPYELKSYYKSNKVKDCYGKCFKICILGYLVTESDIFAIVHLNEILKCFIFEPQPAASTKSDDDINDMITNFQSLSVQNTYKFKTIPLNSKFVEKCKTIELEEENFDSLNINKLSFIHVAQKGEEPFSAWKTSRLFKKCFSGVTEVSGNIQLDHFSEFEGGYSMYRLPNNTWLVKTPRIISVKTLFTGLYI